MGAGNVFPAGISSSRHPGKPAQDSPRAWIPPWNARVCLGSSPTPKLRPCGQPGILGASRASSWCCTGIIPMTGEAGTRMGSANKQPAIPNGSTGLGIPRWIARHRVGMRSGSEGLSRSLGWVRVGFFLPSLGGFVSLNSRGSGGSRARASHGAVPAFPQGCSRIPTASHGADPTAFPPSRSRPPRQQHKTFFPSKRGKPRIIPALPLPWQPANIHRGELPRAPASRSARVFPAPSLPCNSRASNPGGNSRRGQGMSPTPSCARESQEKAPEGRGCSSHFCF